MINDLHVSLTPFVNESRLLKESASLLKAGIVDRVYIAALKSDGLDEHLALDERRSVWRIPLTTRSWPSSLAVQLLKYMEFTIRVLFHAKTLGVSIVTIHSLSLLPLGVIAKKLLGVQLVYDCHELETEIFSLSGVRQKLARIIEKNLIGQVNLVLVVSPSIGDWYKKAYGIKNVYTVMNCPPHRIPTPSRKLREALKIPANKRILIYQGGIVMGRGVEGLLKAFAAQDDGAHVLVLMGYGDLMPLAQDYSRKYKNIFVHPAVSPDVILEYTASADIGVAYIDNPSLNDRYCLPNKLFEYIMVGLPVLVNDAPEMKRIIEKHSIGVVLEELSKTSINDALNKLSLRSRKQLSADLLTSSSIYCWENQANILVEAYQKHVKPTLLSKKRHEK